MSNIKSQSFLLMLVVILGVVGLGALGLKAYLMWKLAGEFGFTIIFFAGMIFLFTCLYRVYKISNSVEENIQRRYEEQKIIDRKFFL